ncbi:hypothetical protein ACGF07_03935 [Kitasatospora sp. NPDC048194]|uniref:hypothetical protein n=1 Tax=Kitasatospora sp. NPDC048194 TaxID=3364045 RepID=UPI003715CFC7
MLGRPLTEDELGDCCSQLPCDFCAELTDHEATIDVEIVRSGARTLYLSYCSEEHLREHLSQPLPAPEPLPERRPESVEQAQGGLGCVFAIAALAGACLLLAVLSAIGVPLWG